MSIASRAKSISKNKHTLSLAGNGSAAILGFCCLALAARLLTRDDMGAWFIFLTSFTIVDMLRSGIIYTSLVRAAASSSNKDFTIIAGSGWMISLIATLLLSIITLGLHFSFAGTFHNKGFLLFIKWYWLAGMVTLPFNYAAWLLQSRQQFDKVLYIRLLNLLSFMICILAGLLLKYNTLEYLFLSFIISAVLPSFFSLWAGWAWIGSIRYAALSVIKELLQFGKYSMGTLMGSNLLRSSDTLIIGLFLTTKEVAIYSLPLKLIEIIEIPIRSFLATAMPAMSKYKNEDQRPALRILFNQYAGILSLVLLPVILGCILFADSLVVIFGGHQYAESANILRILAVYAAFLPLDRFSGVTLDIIGKPAMNFLKVMLMLIVNISGDILAIHFTKDVHAVAVVSIITFLTGLVFGNYILKKYLNHTIKETLQTGIEQLTVLSKPILVKLKELRSGITHST